MSYVTYHEVDKLLASNRDKYLLLLLVEDVGNIPKLKPGINSIAYRIQESLVEEGGPMDQLLTNWSSGREHVNYVRLLLDRSDSKTMTRLGAVYLPQVRIMKRGQNLFRSSVSIGDNGQFLAQDVGGKSFIRPKGTQTEFYNLVDLLANTTDRK